MVSGEVPPMPAERRLPPSRLKGYPKTPRGMAFLGRLPNGVDGLGRPSHDGPRAVQLAPPLLPFAPEVPGFRPGKHGIVYAMKVNDL